MALIVIVEIIKLSEGMRACIYVALFKKIFDSSIFDFNSRQYIINKSSHKNVFHLPICTSYFDKGFNELCVL